VTIFLYEFNPGIQSGIIVVLNGLYVECGKEGFRIESWHFSAGFVKNTKIPNTVASFGDTKGCHRLSSTFSLQNYVNHFSLKVKQNALKIPSNTTAMYKY